MVKNKNLNVPYNVLIESVIGEAMFHILYIKILPLKMALLCFYSYS